MTFFNSVTCCACKVVFGILPETEATLRQSQAGFKCIFGHPLVFSLGESEETKLRRERDRLKQEQARLHARISEEREAREASERRVSAAKGRITRMKNRAATGHCPCCNRVFVDLLSHMKSKHADYEAEPINLDEEIAA